MILKKGTISLKKRLINKNSWRLKMGLLYKIMNVSKSEIETIEDWLFDCEISENEIVEFIRTQIEDLECCIWEISLKALVFEYILNKADISELIEYIEVNEKTGEVNISASKKEIEESMTNILVEDRNDSWLFLVEYFGIDINLEEQGN